MGYIYKRRMLRATEYIARTNGRIARTSGKQLKVQRQIAANTAAQVQMQAAQLEMQKQRAFTAERHRLEALAANYVAEGTMTRAEANEYIELEWVNLTEAPPKASDRILPTVAGVFPRGGAIQSHEAGWYREGWHARYWDGFRWTLHTLSFPEAKALVIQEWKAAGDRAAAQGVPPKSRKVAGLLAIFLGCLGIHRMYLGDVMLGVILAAFCVLSIPFFFGIPTLILGVIEGIMILQNAQVHSRDARGLPLGA